MSPPPKPDACVSRMVILRAGRSGCDLGVECVLTGHGACRKAILGAGQRGEPEPASLDENLIPASSEGRARSIQLDRVARERMDFRAANREPSHRAGDKAVRIRAAACRVEAMMNERILDEHVDGGSDVDAVAARPPHLDAAQHGRLDTAGDFEGCAGTVGAINYEVVERDKGVVDLQNSSAGGDDDRATARLAPNRDRRPRRAAADRPDRFPIGACPDEHRVAGLGGQKGRLDSAEWRLVCAVAGTARGDDVFPGQSAGGERYDRCRSQQHARQRAQRDSAHVTRPCGRSVRGRKTGPLPARRAR